jgi:hypothetical protein
MTMSGVNNKSKKITEFNLDISKSGQRSMAEELKYFQWQGLGHVHRTRALQLTSCDGVGFNTVPGG